MVQGGVGGPGGTAGAVRGESAHRANYRLEPEGPFERQHEEVAAQFRKGCLEILEKTNSVVAEAKMDQALTEEKLSSERERAD